MSEGTIKELAWNCSFLIEKVLLFIISYTFQASNPLGPLLRLMSAMLFIALPLADVENPYMQRRGCVCARCSYTRTALAQISQRKLLPFLCWNSPFWGLNFNIPVVTQLDGGIFLVSARKILLGKNDWLLFRGCRSFVSHPNQAYGFDPFVVLRSRTVNRSPLDRSRSGYIMNVSFSRRLRPLMFLALHSIASETSGLSLFP